MKRIALISLAISAISLSFTMPGYATTKSHADGVCTAQGRSLQSARKAYQRHCSLPRKDCDKIGNRWSCSSEQIGANSPGHLKPSMENRSTTLVLNLVGTGYMYLDLVPDAEIPGEYVEAWCFDVDLIDMRAGNRVGQATDCLDNSRQSYALSDSGIAMIGTTYFTLPGGMLAVQGRTTVQPRNWPTREFTHITGGNSAGNSVLYGSGKYRHANGTTRLSGMVDLSGFKGNVGDPISFDCIFVVDISY